MKKLRKEIEKLVENEDFVSYEEFIFELKEEKEEVKKYLDWRANGFKFHYVSINSNIKKGTKEQQAHL